jgi:hypothetical protein
MISSIKTAFLLTLAIASLLVLDAFTIGSSPSRDAKASSSSTGYIPAGLTADQYAKIRQQDSEKMKGDLARLGPRGFKSRSMQAWQEAYERGEAGHTFAAVGYKEKLRLGEMKWEDVPYMIRGGSWDNSDVLGAKNRLKWSRTDRDYANGGYKKEQSKSILGSGPGFDWSGTGSKTSSTKRLFPGLF